MLLRGMPFGSELNLYFPMPQETRLEEGMFPPQALFAAFPFQTSRIQMELLSPERLREMTFLQSKKGGLPGSEGESSSIYRHQETRLEGES